MLNDCQRCTKNSFKKAVRKIAEANGDLIGNKIANKIIIKVSKTSPENSSETKNIELDRKISPKKIYIFKIYEILLII